jgi:hypothetical protein
MVNHALDQFSPQPSPTFASFATYLATRCVR